MPIYEYRCEDCRRRVSLFYQNIALAAAGADAARCPQCGGARLTRLVSRFNVGRPAERPAYDPAAASLLTERVLAFLDAVQADETS